MLSFKAKAPAAIITYGGDFAAQLAQRPANTTIVSGFSVSVARSIGGLPSDVTLVLATPFLFNSTIISVQVSGGTPGVSYVLLFTAPLSNGETLAGTITLPVQTVVPV